tara:strand:+ start:471 stop:680 length:210 start_codon:yes stop_codon:yes gene_type:complete
MRITRKKKNVSAGISNRDITFNGDPAALSLGWPIIPYSPMHTTAVIPKSHVMDRPTKSNLIFYALYMFP